MKQNPTSDFQRCKTLIERQCLTLKQRRNNVIQRQNNVGTTLIQHCFKLASTNVKANIESNRDSDDYRFANR